MAKIIKTESQYADFITEAIQEGTRKIFDQVWNGVISRSPVLTGNFHFNWNMSKNTPNFSYEKVGVKGSVLGPPKKPRLYFKKHEFPIIYIVNGAPYAQKLEHGSSTQAPQGVVAVTLASIK